MGANIYNPWPIGRVPQHLRRPEIGALSKKYNMRDARDAVGIFEEKVAGFWGAPYGVAVDCCTHAIELALRYTGYRGEIVLPERTYISVPMMALNIGLKVRFEDIHWEGGYKIEPTNVWDMSVRWMREMYIPGSLICLSFQIKKRIPIGRGGMILTDSQEAYKMMKLMSYDGRDLNTPYDSPEHVKCIGYHYYMTPEDAARGVLLMDQIDDEGDYMDFTDYPRVDKIMAKLNEI